MLDLFKILFAASFFGSFFWFTFDSIKGFRKTRAILNFFPTLIEGLFIQSHIYEVSRVGRGGSSYSWYSDGYSSIIVKDDGINVPVKCSEGVYATISDMLSLNKDRNKVMIKAKISKKKLKLVSVQGYLIK